MRKMPECFSSSVISFLIAILILAADQISKWYAVSILGAFGGGMRDGMREIAPFFNFVLVKNTGVSFGLFSEEASPAILAGVAIAITLGLLLFVFMKRRVPTYYRLPVAVVVGGSIGNIIDRIRLGYVVDFLDFHLYQYHWPAFNVADSAVVIGVGMLLLLSFFEGKCGKRELERI